MSANRTQKILDDLSQVLRDNGAKGQHIAALVVDLRNQRDAALAEAAAHKAEAERLRGLLHRARYYGLSKAEWDSAALAATPTEKES